MNVAKSGRFLKSNYAAVLISLIFLCFLAGCSVPQLGALNKTSQPAPQEIPPENGAGKQEAAVSFSTSSAQPLLINIPEKSLEQNLKITGKASPGSKILINDKEFYAGPDGSLNVEVSLTPGSNLLAVTAVSNDGKSIYSTSKKVEYAPKPRLEITQPSDISNKSLTIQGVTDPNCTVDVNGYKTQSDDRGNFKVAIPSTEGNNPVKIVSTNKAGKSSYIQKVITQTQ